jgi:hypothetical protein
LSSFRQPDDASRASHGQQKRLSVALQIWIVFKTPKAILFWLKERSKLGL